MTLDFAAVLSGANAMRLLEGLRSTLALTAASWLLAYALGIALAVVRSAKSGVLRWLVATYVEFHRNVPLLVLILLWYFGIFTLAPGWMQSWTHGPNSEFRAAAIAIGLCMAAYVSEDIRSAIRSLSAGQNEAARALGLSYLQTAAWVILPQAFRIATPLLVNRAIIFFKGTALAMTIGVAELTYVTREIENATFRTFEAYLVATSVYVLLSLVIMGAGALIEHRYAARER
jgi:polar amino acid transport system permease protein